MKNLVVFLLLCCFGTSLFAQTADQADPAAKRILDRLKAKYEDYKTLEADFTLILEFPEEEADEQRGSIQQSGEKFKLDMAQQMLISDGETVWLYLKNNQEVQINKAEFDEEEMEGFMSPKDFVGMYESGKFAYVLVDERPENGRIIQQIEFKPLDRDSEYSKLRMTIDRDKQEVLRLKAFSKDGSRYTFRMDKLRPNVALSDSDFIWKTSICPDCYVEDLRID